MSNRAHVYALGTKQGKSEVTHFGEYHLWTVDFEDGTPEQAAITLLEKWHGIQSTEADFEVTATYESTEQARERYKTIPERVYALRYLPHLKRAEEIGARFVDHLALHDAWWVRKIEE